MYLATLKLKRDSPRNVMKNGAVALDIAGEVFKGRAKKCDAKRLEHVKALLSQKYWAAWLGSWFGMGPEGAFVVTIDRVNLGLCSTQRHKRKRRVKLHPETLRSSSG